MTTEHGARCPDHKDLSREVTALGRNVAVIQSDLAHLTKDLAELVSIQKDFSREISANVQATRELVAAISKPKPPVPSGWFTLGNGLLVATGAVITALITHGPSWISTIIRAFGGP